MFRSIKTRIIASFLAILAIIVALTAYVNFQYTYRTEHATTDVMGYSAALSCASFLDIATDESVDFDPKTEDYSRLRTSLRTLCQESSMDYLYALDCDPETRTATYLICVAADDEADKLVERKCSYGTAVPGGLSDLAMDALAGNASRTALELDNEFGHTLDWFSRVDADGQDMLAGASYPVDAQRKRVMERTMQSVIPSILAVLALLVVQLMVLRRYVFDPLHTISNRMREFSAEHASETEPLNIPAGNEMGDIAEAFEQMADDIGDYIVENERMTTERVHTDVELDVARRIQEGMVPARTNLASGMFSLSAFARPARAVGGDFYDCFVLEDGRIAAVIGDVSGKGMASALFMTMARTMIHDGLIMGANPANLLNRVNEQLCQANPEGMFITVLAVVFDPSTGRAHFANAGHMPPFIVGNDVRELAMDPGVILGLFEDADIEQGEICLEPDESLFMYTDGATEAVDCNNEFLGIERLAASLQTHAPYATPEAVVDEVARIVDAFAEGHEQFDDLTLVACMRHANAQADVHGETCAKPVEASDDFTEIPVAIKSFAVIRDAIMEGAAPDAAKRKLCLACEEAFANIVGHSGAGHAWFKIETTGDDGGASGTHEDGSSSGSTSSGMRVTLVDDGAPFDPTADLVMEKDFDDLDSGGMGISLIRQLASRVSYQREKGRNVLTLG